MRKKGFKDEAPNYNFEQSPKPTFLKDLNGERFIVGLRAVKRIRIQGKAKRASQNFDTTIVTTTC